MVFVVINGGDGPVRIRTSWVFAAIAALFIGAFAFGQPATAATAALEARLRQLLARDIADD